MAGRQASTGGLVVVKLGAWLDNAHKRTDKLTEQRRAGLDALDMRWWRRRGGDCWVQGWAGAGGVDEVVR